MQGLFLAAMFTFFSFSATAATTLTSTDLEISKAPSLEQLQLAREALLEAIRAKQSGDDSLFIEKLNQAEKLQQFQTGIKTFRAAFILQHDRTKLNYFSEDEIRYDVNIETTCYAGDIKEAMALLKTALKYNLIGSDELWYENPRTQGKDILMDLVDGPNNLRDEVSIQPCRAR